MPYSSPASINASRGFTEILYYVNNVTDQWFSNMIMIAIWIIVLASVYKAKGDFVGGLAVSGFAIFVVGLLFWLGGFISGITFGVVVGFTVLSVIPLFMDK